MTSEFLQVGLDLERANAARIYDYLLGGAHNFAVDREQAAKILAQNPEMAYVCQANRSYLRRVVEWCLDQGVRQFLDLGSGVPTVGNVHEIALAHDPEARVAYVDIEPVAVAHARSVVADLPGVTVTQADLLGPRTVLSSPGVAGLLDFSRPIALLCVAVLHFIPDPRLPELLARYRAALAPGSVQALSHGSLDHDDAEVADRLRAAMEGYRGSASEARSRSRAEIHELLGGHELVAPGMVDLVDWPSPDAARRRTGGYGAVVRF